MKINNKHILITGASRGIGEAFALKCAPYQTHLLLIMRSPNEALKQKLLDCGALSVKIFITDLSVSSELEKLISVLNSYPIDIVFNNAGLLTGGLLEEQPWGDIDKMLQVNLYALMRLTQALLPQMIQRGEGKIINNSSVSGLMYFPCASTYAASKAAVMAFTECLEVELNGTGVSTLLLLTPGIKTKMFDQIRPLYGKNLKVPTHSISALSYADKIINAISQDKTILAPSFLSPEGLGLWIAKYQRRLFKWGVRTKFHRS